MRLYGFTRLITNSTPLMETTLEAKKQRILKRLEATIDTTSSILCEINQELEDIIAANGIIERTAAIYDIWVSKE